MALIPIDCLLHRVLERSPNRDMVLYAGTPYARTIRFCRAGDLILDVCGDVAYESTALVEGVYVLATHTSKAAVEPVRLFLCSLGAIGKILDMDAQALPPHMIEALRVSIFAWGRSREMHALGRQAGTQRAA